MAHVMKGITSKTTKTYVHYDTLYGFKGSYNHCHLLNTSIDLCSGNSTYIPLV